MVTVPQYIIQQFTNDNTMTKQSEETDLALIKQDIGYIKRDVRTIKRRVEANYVTRAEFEPIQKLVYGLVGLILVSVIGAVLGIVLIG